MTIGVVDLVPAYHGLAGQIDAALLRFAVSGWHIGGPEVAAFEQAFAVYCRAEHCSGLDALHLALRATDVGHGNEVIIASNSCIATVLAVTLAGATPILVEPNPRTYNLDHDRTEAAITPRTRVILPTHLYGQPTDLGAILAIAAKRGLRVLEDAAQAHGARYDGRLVGAHGYAVAWNFYPSKNLGAFGDAGALTPGHPVLAERMRTLGNCGSKLRYANEVRGVNSRLDPIQAAVLGVKLPYPRAWNLRRQEIAAFYIERFRPHEHRGTVRPQSGHSGLASLCSSGARPRKGAAGAGQGRRVDAKTLPDPATPAGCLRRPRLAHGPLPDRRATRGRGPEPPDWPASLARRHCQRRRGGPCRGW